MKIPHTDCMIQRIDQSVAEFIEQVVKEITHSPGGYVYWQHLPEKGYYGQSALPKRWERNLTYLLLPWVLKKAMLKASLTEDGTPDNRGKALYYWMMKNVYNGNVKLLYKEWIVAIKD